MRKILQTILGIIIMMAIVVILYITLLYPRHSYTMENIDKDNVSISSILLKAIPKEFIGGQNRVNVEINITKEEIAKLVYSITDEKENIKNIDVELEDGKVKVFVLKEYLNTIPLEATFDLDIKSENERLLLILNEANLGKLDLGVNKTLNKIKDMGIPFIEVRTVSKEIILSDEDLNNVLEITEVKAADGNINIKLGVKFSSMEDFIKIIGKLTKG